MNRTLKSIWVIMLLILMPGGVFAADTGADNLENKINETTAQVSSTLDKARKLINVATTTAGVAVDVYKQGEQAVSSTAEVVRRGSAVYNNLKPLITKTGDLWNRVTNNNEFWRVALVVSGAIVLWIIIRFSI